MTLKTRQINWATKSFRGTADLTIKGVTKTVKFTGKLTGVKQTEEGGKKVTRVGIQANAVVDRKAFGIQFGGFSEGLGMVGEKVKIVLNAELVK